MAKALHNNIVIFGGSSGIGLAVARLAIAHLPSPNIILCSSNREKLNGATALVREVEGSRGVVYPIVADLSNSDTQFDNVENVLRQAKSTFEGPIDHIIWTAGGTIGLTQSDKRSNDDLLAVQTVRVFGPLTLLHLAPDYMTESRLSSITITSGVRVYRPTKGRGRATAAAAALDGAVRGLAVDLAPIRVNGVVLGAIHTPLLDRFAPRDSEAAKGLAEQTLLGRIGDADEAAEAYLYSMRCGYATGSMIVVDGGAMLR